MKGMPGLMLALGLGVVAAAANWIYMAKRSEQAETIEFVGVKDRIDVGQRFGADHFVPVPIPRMHVGELEKFAVKWSARETLYGFPANRGFVGGEIVLEDDLRTRARRRASEKIGANEVAKAVLVDTRTFVSQNVNPGDLVAFTLPSVGSGTNRTKTLGPFRILYLGTRGGDLAVERASGSTASAESTITIACEMLHPPQRITEGPRKGELEPWDGELEPRAEELFELLRLSNYQAAEVSLFSDKLAEPAGD